MWRKIRYSLAILLLLLVGLIGVTLHLVHQARLNQDLLIALKDYYEDSDENNLQALSALRSGADANSWAYLNDDDDIEQPNLWSDWFHIIPWPLGGKQQREHFRTTALAFALWDDNPLLVKALLDRGANVEAEIDSKFTPYKQSPLEIAVASQNDEMINLLLDHHANINALRTVYQVSRRTYLMLAVSPFQKGWCSNLRLVHLLLRRGVNVNLKDAQGKTALNLALDYSRDYPEDHEEIEVIQTLKAAEAKN